MLTQKLFMRGHVTIECLNDVVGGPATIISYFEDAMYRWAHNNNLFLATKPKEFIYLTPVTERLDSFVAAIPGKQITYKELTA